jgi:putative Holliday junction resolvase
MHGRVLAIDLGSKRVGVAISDELRISVRPLTVLTRTSWKSLCASIIKLCEEFDVKMIVLGLPLRLDGSEGDAASEVRRIARNLTLSQKLPVELQDERYTSKDAEANLSRKGLQAEKVSEQVDSESAAIILNDFLARPNTTASQTV